MKTPRTLLALDARESDAVARGLKMFVPGSELYPVAQSVLEAMTEQHSAGGPAIVVSSGRRISASVADLMGVPVYFVDSNNEISEGAVSFDVALVSEIGAALEMKRARMRYGAALERIANDVDALNRSFDTTPVPVTIAKLTALYRSLGELLFPEEASAAA